MYTCMQERDGGREYRRIGVVEGGGERTERERKEKASKKQTKNTTKKTWNRLTNRLAYRQTDKTTAMQSAWNVSHQFNKHILQLGQLRLQLLVLGECTGQGCAVTLHTFQQRGSVLHLRPHLLHLLFQLSHPCLTLRQEPAGHSNMSCSVDRDAVLTAIRSLVKKKPCQICFFSSATHTSHSASNLQLQQHHVQCTMMPFWLPKEVLPCPRF